MRRVAPLKDSHRIFSWGFLLGVLFCMGCTPVCHRMEPHISCTVPLSQIKTFPSPFALLTPDERREVWGQELLIGETFAREGDFYRAITAYRRAEILLPHPSSRELQVIYDVVLCYYLGGKYQECINVFEESSLSCVGPDFPAFDSLLLILYESYLKVEQIDKANCVLEIIRKYFPDCYKNLELYQSFQEGNIDKTRDLIQARSDSLELKQEFEDYDRFSKSPRTARALNALIPGMGYYYVGQKKSALTSFVINALFTATAYQFFSHGYFAAGAITASLEAGWYFGGINGAGIEAQEFNTRLFEGVGRKMCCDHHCFPVLMFESSF